MEGVRIKKFAPAIFLFHAALLVFLGISLFFPFFLALAEENLLDYPPCPSPHIRISQLYGAGKDAWIELYNPGDSAIDLSAAPYRIERATASGGDPKFFLAIGNASHGSYPGGTIISPKGFYLIVDADASDALRSQADSIINSDRSFALTDNNVVYLATGSVGAPADMHNTDGDIIDYVGYGAAPTYEGASPAPPPTSTLGIIRANGTCDFADTNENGTDFILSSPLARNTRFIPSSHSTDEISLEEDPSTEPAADEVPLFMIIFNEILPNPKGADDDAEYIELYNGGESTADLAGWTVKDAKNGSYVFPKDTIVNVSDYILFFRSVFEFALNNSGTETLSLFMPDDTLVDTISYSETAKEGLSYSRTRSGAWRWSKTQTPGAENIIPSAPSIGRTTISKKLYVDVAGDFSLDLPDDSTKDISVRWDFGDGRKSYKVVTRHTYTQSGTFFGSVRLTIDGDAVTEAFIIVVKNYPQQKVRVTGLLPNPDGTDKDSEWIEVENRSSKKVSLLGWSIATGQTQKKLVNHPIKTDVRIAPGKRVRLSAEDAAFTLANTKSRVELRYPNGTVAHTVTYKTEGVAKNARYEKPRGERWRWSIKEDAPDPTSPPSPPDENSAEGFEEVGPTEGSQEEGIVLGYSTEQLPISSLLCKKNMVTTQRLQRAAVGLSFAPSLALHTEIPSKLSVTERSLFSNINTILNALFIRR